ncbi:MAG: hypothetical protein AAF202_03740 [Pseudomonadota bacterium]
MLKNSLFVRSLCLLSVALGVTLTGFSAETAEGPTRRAVLAMISSALLAPSINPQIAAEPFTQVEYELAHIRNLHRDHLRSLPLHHSSIVEYTQQLNQLPLETRQAIRVRELHLRMVSNSISRAVEASAESFDSNLENDKTEDDIESQLGENIYFDMVLVRGILSLELLRRLAFHVDLGASEIELNRSEIEDLNTYDNLLKALIELHSHTGQALTRIERWIAENDLWRSSLTFVEVSSCAVEMAGQHKQ